MHPALTRLQRGLPWLRRQNWLRSTLLCLSCLGALAIYCSRLEPIYPLKDWLFLQLAKIFAWSAYLHAACVASGAAFLSRVLRIKSLPFKERLLTSMGVGLVLFVLAMYALGALGLYKPVAAILLPGLMLVVGLPTLTAEWRAHRAALTTRPLLGAPFWLQAGTVLGIACLGLLYLQAMTPEALNYDSRWYHLTVGEDYAREGRIVPFFADYNKAAFPQLTGFLYTWCSLLPGLDTPLRVMWLLHNEYFFVLWTLLGVAAAVEWMLGDSLAPGAWTAFCLFPGIFVYDSNLGGSADHFLGFFAAPLFLAAMRAVQGFAPSACVLLGILTGGAALTKYQAAYLVIGVAPVIAASLLWGLLRRRKAWGKKNLWLGPLLIVATSTLVTLPHFLKNCIFYHNPVYPYWTSFFQGSYPLQPETAASVSNMWMERSLRPEGSIFERLFNALQLVFTFSLDPHYSVSRPVFGSLFSLLLPAALFVREKRRLWLGISVATTALMFWGYTYLVDRYLQTFSALLVAVTAVLIVRIWQAGFLARLGVFLLTATQLVWGADAYVYSGYGHIQDSLALIRSGFDGQAARRFDKYLRETRHIDEKLPKDAVLLFHNTRLSLGVQRRVYQDLPGYQSLVSYRPTKSARDVVEMYRSHGITHVVLEPGSWKALTRQEDVVFAMLYQHHIKERFRSGRYEVFTLPKKLPPPEATYRVLSIGLPGYVDGIYNVDQLNTLEPLPGDLKQYATPKIRVGEDQAKDHLGELDAVLVKQGRTLPSHLTAALNRQFIRVFSFRHEIDVHVRRQKIP